MGESKARERLRVLVATGELPHVAGTPGLAEEAREQGLTGVLLAALERARREEDASFVPSLHAERRARLATTLRQIGLAARAQAVLASAGIRSLPLKGAVLAETVYDLESDRPMGDVDLLALEGWSDAAAALVAAGFDAGACGDHAQVLVESGSGLVLELHRSPTSAPGLFPFEAEGLWSRRRTGAGQLKLLPSVEDLLLQLALHAAFQHGFVLSLVQWLDFRRVLERERLDTDLLAGLARDCGALLPLAGALLAAAAVCQAPLPSSLRTRLEAVLPRGLRRWLAPRLGDPLRLVRPTAPALGRARWELLAGRRGELLWRTLVLPETASGDARLGPRLRQGAARAVRLGWGALASLTGQSPGD